MSSSAYPTGYDDDLPTDHVNDVDEEVDAADINKMADAIKKMQHEVGLNPSGTDTDVTARLARIEAALASEGSPYSDYGPGAPAAWVPFASTSPFNKPIPDSPTIHPQSAAYVAKVTSPGWLSSKPADIPLGVASENIAPFNSDFDHPIYFSKPTDPLYTIGPTGDAYSGWDELYGVQIRIPNKARGANGSDAHLTVIDLVAGTVYDFYHFQFTDPIREAPNGGGSIIAKSGSVESLTGDGVIASTLQATDAAWFSLAALVIRPEELIAGQINHALSMIVKSTDGTFVAPALGTAGSVDPNVATTTSGSHTLPVGTITVVSTTGFKTAGTILVNGTQTVTYTGKTGTTFTGCTGGTGVIATGSSVTQKTAPPCGARFRLNMTFAEIDALSAPGYRKTIWKAMSRYGMYVRDTGSTSWTVNLSGSYPYMLAGQVDPWRKFGQDQGIYYTSGSDYYLLELHGAAVGPFGNPDWVNKLQLLDWTDPANR